MADTAQSIGLVETTLAPDFSSDIVVFKVESTIFRVLRSGLAASSPLFETMFLLPRGDGQQGEEGTTKDHPIVLEGYKASDFDALMRVVYPTWRDLVSGGLTLKKDQWIGALRLSTIWEMTEIREYAIKKLSNMPTPLSAAEKVSLSRAHKVPSWLVEGLVALTDDIGLSPDELEAAAGLRTAFRILIVRTKRLSSNPVFSTLRLSGGGTYAGVRISDFRFGCCEKPFQKDAFRACESCSTEVPASRVGGVYLKGNQTLCTSTTTFHFRFQALNVLCTSCNGRFIGYSVKCHSCGTSDFIYIFPGNISDDHDLSTESLVREVFADEISDYEAH